MARKRSKGERVTARKGDDLAASFVAAAKAEVDRTRARAASAPGDEPMTEARALRSLERLRKKREQLDDQADELVAAARDLGLSWERIGHALGMTGTGARKRFSGS